MRKHISVFMFCLLSCGLSAKTVTTVKTELKSGESNSYTLDETGQMSFSGRSLQLQQNATDNITVINLEDVERLNFSNGEASVIDQIADSKLRVYPNPVVDVLNVEFEGDAEIQIISADGRVMLSQKVSDKGSVDVSGLAAGIYWVKIGGLTVKIEKL